jgi:drug/metabolite transporter (DMT)-like permease
LNGCPELLLYTLIAIMVFFWSGNFIVGKFALREFPPVLLGALRVSVAGLMMLPIYGWERRRKIEKWSPDDVRLLLGLGIFGVALNQLFFVYGLSRTSVAHSAIIIGLTPILVLLLAAMRGQERISMRKSAGMAIALLGVALLKSFETQPPHGRGPTWTGDFFIFLASLTFSLFTVFGKSATQRHSTVTVNTFAYVGAAVALTPVTLWEGARFVFAQVTWVGWSCLTYMALFPSVICYLIYYYALSHMMPSRVSAFSYLQPPLVTVMGVVLLGEHVTLALVLSAAVVFAGVYLAERD